MITKELHSMYPSGSRVSNKELKEVLQRLYNKYGLKVVATASDITRYGYRVKPCKLTIDDKRINGKILML